MAENIFIPGFEDGYNKTIKFSLDTIEAIPNSVIVYIKGSIDNYNHSYCAEKFNNITQSRYKNVIFKCANLDYISSSGIGILTKFFSELKAKGGNLVFMDLQSKVYEVFKILGFTNFFNIKASMEEVIEFFKDSNTEVAIFPLSFECPVCQAHLKTTHEGKFRCSACKAIISVDESGKITI